MKKSIQICEVGPRDGFQSIKCAQIPTEQKVEIIEELLAAGVKHMEFTSFVSPKAIPQMADAADVTKTVLARHPEADLFALVPNLRGNQFIFTQVIDKLCLSISAG